MNKEEIINLVNTIDIPREEFVILSTGALVLRGIYESAKDLDIAVTKKGLEELKKKYNIVSKDDGWYIVNDLIECIEDEMINKKELVGEYYLEDIRVYLSFLENSGREKDKVKIPIVKEYISTCY